MADLIAVDVVFRPDPQTEKLSIQLSDTMPALAPYRLNLIDRFPHVSVVMACVDRSDLEAFASSIGSVAQAINSFESPLTLVKMGEDGKQVFCLELEKGPGLQAHHEQIVKAVRPFMQPSSDGSAYVLDLGESLREKTKSITENFLQNSSFEKYWPHITVGKEEMDSSLFPWPVQGGFDRLAIFQLGNHNTCRKLLNEWPLKA